MLISICMMLMKACPTLPRMRREFYRQPLFVQVVRRIVASFLDRIVLDHFNFRLARNAPKHHLEVNLIPVLTIQASKVLVREIQA